ncbi:hypothetical protein BJX61DRAFT_538562 [Aspergillus egyptiacus]|nr:hypothetical protein BJX61DRAFT_538562 [Aspergillus egyptiacus]
MSSESKSESESIPTPTPQILPRTSSHHAAVTLTQSLLPTPLTTYYLNSPKTRTPAGRQADTPQPRIPSLTPTQKALTTSIYKSLTKAHTVSGLVLTAGPHHAAVALWLPPGSWTWKARLKSRMWMLWLRLGNEGRARVFGSWYLLEEGMRKVMGFRAEETWVLTGLGTKERYRGKGFGRGVVEGGLRLADEQREPVYLQCFEENVAFFERFGFVRKGTVSLDRALEPVVLQCMVREPRKG